MRPCRECASFFLSSFFVAKTAYLDGVQHDAAPQISVSIGIPIDNCGYCGVSGAYTDNPCNFHIRTELGSLSLAGLHSALSLCEKTFSRNPSPVAPVGEYAGKKRMLRYA